MQHFQTGFKDLTMLWTNDWNHFTIWWSRWERLAAGLAEMHGKQRLHVFVDPFLQLTELLLPLVSSLLKDYIWAHIHNKAEPHTCSASCCHETAKGRLLSLCKQDEAQGVMINVKGHFDNGPACTCESVRTQKVVTSITHFLAFLTMGWSG